MKYELSLWLRKASNYGKSLGVDRLPLVNPLYNTFRRLLEPEVATMEYEGHMLCYRPGMPELSIEMGSVHEPEVTATIKRHLAPGKIALDIGGYLGYHTLAMRDAVGSDGTVITFEPDPNNAALLQETISKNDFSNVFLERVAVGHKNGTVNLSKPEEGPSLPSTISGFDKGENITVQSVSLSDYLDSQSISCVSFAKIDVEGGEYDILCQDNGFRRIQTIVAEIHQDRLSPDQIDEILSILSRHGKVTDLDGNEPTNKSDNFHILYRKQS